MFQVRPEAPEFEVWVEPLDSVQGVLAGTGAGACAFIFWMLDICYRERRCEELRIFSCVGLQDIGVLQVKFQAHKCHAALLDTKKRYHGAEENQSRSEAARVQLDPSEYCGRSPTVVFVALRVVNSVSSSCKAFYPASELEAGF